MDERAEWARLSGRVAVVTGASSGIGLATAERLATAGARLILSGRDADRLGELAARLKGEAVVADLATADGAAELAERVMALAPHVDILVCNAGRGWASEITAMREPDIAGLVAVNLTAPMLLTRALLPHMLGRRHGHLGYVSSIAGRLGVRNEAVYAATKAGLDVFAESLRMELAGTGVAVSVLVPALVDTPFFARREARMPARRAPAPVSAQRAAAELVAAIANHRDEVYLPAWMRMPVAVRAIAPGAYRALARRFG